MKELTIGDKIIGDGRPVFIIAEVGSNHDGILDRAISLIDEAADAGADAVKFQLFTEDGLVNPAELPEAYRTIKKLKLPREWLPKLKTRCTERGVEFLCAPFDEDSADALAALGAPAFKIASGDVTHLPLIEKIAKFGKPVFLSVGAADKSEIADALAAARTAGNDQIGLMHCVPLYPTPPDAARIAAIRALREEFGCLCGFSDHGEGGLGAALAVACGAVAYERHITLSRALKGPDHYFACEITEFAALVKNIRTAQAMLGAGGIAPSPAERAARFNMRRGVYAAKDVPANSIIKPEDLKCVRPMKGHPPAALHDMIGGKTICDLKENEAVEYVEKSELFNVERKEET